MHVSSIENVRRKLRREWRTAAASEFVRRSDCTAVDPRAPYRFPNSEKVTLAGKSE
jgi:hypothetical protein